MGTILTGSLFEHGLQFVKCRRTKLGSAVLFHHVDASGRPLPLDPSRTPVDVPIVAGPPRDTAVYHLLGAMQQQAPRLYARLSSVTHDRLDEITFRLNDISVRTMTSVTLARLADIEPVERDLARRQLRAAELDLRYRDQVIARLP